MHDCYTTELFVRNLEWNVFKKTANGIFLFFLFVCFFVLLLFLQFTHTISTGDMQHFEHLEPLTC